MSGAGLDSDLGSCRTHTCQRTVDLLQDLLSQQVDEPGDHLRSTNTNSQAELRPQEGPEAAPGTSAPTWGNFLLMELRAPSGNLASSESRTAWTVVARF